ncbi:Porin [Rubrivivax sp. A210]|uniref:porin n=1 Tax=Rubrivivax sp. A210 TaxID=2772301 RepID=UPI00191944CD|nr:porin [Rubrivivax sp. A210]CAD5372581.1 Porin [Rubrivivax sp. A210]
MKKLFALSALALAATTCAAQSSVTIYGILDGGVTRVSGLKGGSVKALSSGIMDGSRLGFRGNEDLGGGYRAIFTMEHRFEMDNGTVSNRPASGSQLPDRVSQATQLGLPTVFQPVVTAVAASIGNTIGVNLAGGFWDRQIYAGLITPFGAIIAGRQYTPAYEISATFDTMGTQSALAAGQVGAIPSAIDIRLSNSIAYRIQKDGFTASLMVAAGENSTTTGHMMGGMVMYKGERFSVGFGYNSRENERAEKSLTSTIIGGTLNLGPGTAYAAMVQVKDDHPSGLSGIAASVTGAVGPTNAAIIQNAFINGFKQDGRILHGGYKLTTGPNTVYVAYSRFDDKRIINADTSSYGVAYTYSLSKRTDLNAVLTRFVNSGSGQAAPGGAGYLGGVTSAAGVDSTSMALGLRHRF